MFPAAQTPQDGELRRENDAHADFFSSYRGDVSLCRPRIMSNEFSCRDDNTRGLGWVKMRDRRRMSGM